MELKNWLALGTVAVAATAALVLRGQSPSTAPTTQAAVTTAPSTQAVARTPATRSSTNIASSNDNNSGRRNNNNGSGNNGFGNTGRRSRNGNGFANNRGGGDTSTVSSSDPFAVLQMRSIFIKGNQNVTQDLRSAPAPRVNNIQGRPESELAFNGVIITNGEPLALVEDLRSNEVVRVRTGDPVAGGKVAAITFDDLTYSANGRTLHVAIGQNLEGSFPTFNTPVAPPASSDNPTTMPAPTVTEQGPGPVSAPPGDTTIVHGQTSQDDIIAKLRARRAAENAGR